MGWTAPRTWVVGEIVTAALMNTHIHDNLDYLKGIDQVPTIGSGLIIANTDGDEYLKLPLLSTAECTTVLTAEGQVAHDETTHRIKVYDGTAVRSLVSTVDVDDTPADSATTDPISSNWAYDHLALLTTAGDIIYATNAGVWARLGKGGANQLLRQNAALTAPEWATVTPATIVRKTADEVVNNSLTLQDDNHLLLAVAANEVWVLRFILNFVQGNNAGMLFKFAVTAPASATGVYGGVFNGATNVEVLKSTVTLGNAISVAVIAANETAIITVDAIITNAANAGNITLQWAQVVAGGINTSLLTNSCLIAHKLA